MNRKAPPIHSLATLRRRPERPIGGLNKRFGSRVSRA
jgi:hypothetical protein